MDLAILLGIAPALNNSLELLKKARNREGVSSTDIDTLEIDIGSIKESLKEIGSDIDQLRRWKIIHNITQIVIIVERRMEFDLLFSESGGFSKLMSSADEEGKYSVYAQCYRKHQGARRNNGSLLELDKYSHDLLKFEGIDETRIVPEGQDWWMVYRDFMADADRFYDEASKERGPSYRECEIFREKVMAMERMMTRLNHVADAKILHFVDRITNAALAQK